MSFLCHSLAAPSHLPPTLLACVLCEQGPAVSHKGSRVAYIRDIPRILWEPLKVSSPKPKLFSEVSQVSFTCMSKMGD